MNEIVNLALSPLAIILGVVVSSLTILRESGRLWAKFRYKSLEKSKIALECQSLDTETKEVLEKEYAAQSFKSVYGFYAGEEYRHSLFRLCENSNGRIILSNYKYSDLYLTYVDGVIKAKLTAVGLVVVPFKIFVSLYLFLLAAFLWFSPIYGEVSTPVAIASPVFAVIFMICSGIQGATARAYFDCREVKKEIERQNKLNLEENKTTS
ncbi:hypothetical protein SD340_003657 [Vibrio fluvialis]|nr:hypothetical protein [Vibrio fluvialis]ELP2652381.1 hypothetical protein [Vibrio fluvialis]ELU8401760.1 hypothetical protein [Vibrio fluvialis]